MFDKETCVQEEEKHTLVPPQCKKRNDECERNHRGSAHGATTHVRRCVAECSFWFAPLVMHLSLAKGVPRFCCFDGHIFEGENISRNKIPSGRQPTPTPPRRRRWSGSGSVSLVCSCFRSFQIIVAPKFMCMVRYHVSMTKYNVYMQVVQRQHKHIYSNMHVCSISISKLGLRM